MSSRCDILTIADSVFGLRDWEQSPTLFRGSFTAERGPPGYVTQEEDEEADGIEKLV